MNPRFPLVLSSLCLPLAAQWHVAAPLLNPPLRTFPGLAHDVGHGQTVLFGGMRSTAPIGAVNDTWTFDGSNWTQQTPANSPPARAGIGLVFDFFRGVVVMYGGTGGGAIGGPSLSDTWEWDGFNWTPIATAHTAGPRGRYGAAFDVVHNRTVIYGGIASSLLLGALGGTWEYNGVDWTQVTTANSPGLLQDPAMCYDFARQRVVLFGGVNPLTGATAGTWEYNGTNWIAVPVSGPQPPARTLAAMVWDAMRGGCVLHGGSGVSGDLDDTWSFDGTHWTQLHGATTPPTRAFGFAFDLARSVGVALLGPNSSGNSANTYEYDGAQVLAYGNGCPGSNGVPLLSASAGPRLGLSFQLTMTNLVPGIPIAAIVTGFSATTYNGVPLPADATPIGMPGCSVLAALDIIDLTSASLGTATHTVVVPNSTAYVGLPVFQQGASLDPGLNAFGAALSNGVAALVGW